MAIPTYTQGYPPDGSSLGQTKVPIRDNLDGTFLTLGVDHVNNNGQPGSNPSGYHTVIHQVTQTGVNTAPMPGFNQIFSGVPGTIMINASPTSAIPNNGDTQLYTLTAQGGISQLTGSSTTTNGFVWVAGILMQWGLYSVPNSGGAKPVNQWPVTTQSITFATLNYAFPVNCLSVMTTFQGLTANASGDINVNNFTKNSFSWTFTGSKDSNFTGFYWLAIGY